MLRFAKKDPDKKTEKERISKESKQLHDEAIGAAQNCLNAEIFLKYRREYEALEKKVIEELFLIDALETDPVKYGFQCKDVVAKLKNIRVLLGAVESDSGRKR